MREQKTRLIAGWLLLGCLALALRVWSLYTVDTLTDGFHTDIERNQPSSAFMGVDALVYDRKAQALLDGRGFGFPFQPPGTQALLAAAYWFGGTNSFLPAKLMWCLMGSASTVLLGLGATLLFGTSAGFLSGLFMACSTGQIILHGSINAEAPGQLLLVAAWLTLVRLEKGKGYSRTNVLMAGILLGLAVLVRAEFVVLLPLTGLWVWKNGKGTRLSASVLILSAALMIAPWTVRNWVYLHDLNTSQPFPYEGPFPWISANGPSNFYLGNTPGSTGGFTRTLLFGKSALDPRVPDEKNILENGYRMGWENILADPLGWVRLEAGKFQALAQAFGYGLMRSNLPGGVSGTKILGDVWVPERKLPAAFWVLSLLAGAWLLLKREGRWREISLFLVPIIPVLLSTFLFLGLARSGLMVLPFLFPLMSVAWIEVWKRFGLPSGSRWLAALIFLGALVVWDLSWYGSRYALRTMFHAPEVEALSWWDE